jgi:thymidine phosphorylase
MNFLSLIENKREGKTLAPEQIQEFIREFTAGKIPSLNRLPDSVLKLC